MARYVIVLILSVLALRTDAQQCGGNRYQQRVFAQSYKTSNVVFGNAPSLPPMVYLGESVTQNVDLTMDVYQPFGDTLRKRPLVLLSFGGAFLIGSKNDEDIQSVSDSLARRGYVAACINYRLGMNVADAVSAERAIYRALQDFSAAVRYFKEHANQYNIDTNYIYVGGVSAGGFAALHMALVDESDRPASTFGAGGLNPRPDLGCKDCSGNNYAHSSNVRGVINYWGAIGDPNWIKPNTVKPLVSFHGDQDFIVPYNSGLPFTAMAQLPQVHGSGAIKQRYDQLGAYNQHYKFEGEGHNIWGLIVMNNFTPGPTQHYLPIYNATTEFLFEQTRPEKPAIQGFDTVCAGTVATYSVPLQPGLKYCWQVTGGQMVSQSANQVQVYWLSGSNGSVALQAISHLDAVSEVDTLPVIIQPKPIAAIETPQGTEVCSGNRLVLNSLFAANNYQWLPANFYGSPNDSATVLEPLISGLYYLQVSDTNGCTGRDSVYVTVKPSPLQPVISQQGDTLIAAAGNGLITWYTNDSAMVAYGDVFIPNSEGAYFAVETASNGCVAGSLTFAYSSTLVISLSAGRHRVYPNPFVDKVEVMCNEEGSIAVYNLSGGRLGEWPLEIQTTLDLQHLPPGMYFYQIQTAKGSALGRLVKL